MIDLHCHLLPGVDDGPATLEDALALLQQAADHGTQTMVATPHVSAAYPQNTVQSIASATAALRDEAARAGIEIRLETGAELSLLHCEMLRDDQVDGLRLADGPYRLVELPFLATPQTASMLLGMEYRLQPVVLAHPERCVAFQQDSELLGRLVGQGMLVQITASSFTRRFGQTVQRTAWDMLGQGLVHLVASDCHDLRSRPPLMREPLESVGLGELVGILCAENPAAVLAGGRPEAAPPMAPPRSLRVGRAVSRLKGGVLKQRAARRGSQ